MTRHINYATYELDAGSLLTRYEISRQHIGIAERLGAVAILEAVLRGQQSDARFEFTLKDVTVHGKGWDEAGYFLRHLN